MQIWYFIKFLGRLCIWLAQKIVGWFILGKSCRRCRQSATLDSNGLFIYCYLYDGDETRCGITKKKYEKREGE